MTEEARRALKAAAEKATPGRWHWEFNPSTRTGGLMSFGRVVMDFIRWGMNGAQPRLRDERDLMHPAAEYLEVVPGREHHAEWHRTLAHPDAEYIALAHPAALLALLARVEQLEAALGRYKQRETDLENALWAVSDRASDALEEESSPEGVLRWAIGHVEQSILTPARRADLAAGALAEGE